MCIVIMKIAIHANVMIIQKILLVCNTRLILDRDLLTKLRELTLRKSLTVILITF